jgi:hypothetical protein
MKFVKPAIITGSALVALLLVGWFSGFIIWLALETSRKHEEIGKIERLTPADTILPFSFPKDRRGWPFYIEDSGFAEYENTTVEVWIRNTGKEAFTVTVRKIKSKSTDRFSLSPGDDAFILNASLSEFLYESIKSNRLKPVRDEYFTEWPSLFYVRSTSGEPVRGGLRLRSDKEIVLNPPIHFYSEQPPDTL